MFSKSKMKLFSINLIVTIHLFVSHAQLFRRNRLSLIQRYRPIQPNEGDLRLVGSRKHTEGNVEIFHLGRWGSVCDDEWDEREASVVCNSLGFSDSHAIPTSNSRFGKVRNLIWMDNIFCAGDEIKLSDCQFDGWKKHDCSSMEAAGVICKRSTSSLRIVNLASRHRANTSTESRLFFPERLTPPSTPPSDIYQTISLVPKSIRELRIVEGRSSNEGRIEVRFDEFSPWYNMCGDGWSLLEAMVACRQMGLGYAQYALVGQFVGQRSTRIFPAIRCRGTETRLRDCELRSSDGSSSCSNGSANIASVICVRELPDLVPDEKELEKSVYLEDRPHLFLQCAMEENCLSSKAYETNRNRLSWFAETRRLLRFTAKVGNFGTADFLPFLEKSNWEWHSCHRHYHSMEIFAHFDIIDHNNRKVAEGHKASFCLEDNECIHGSRAKYSCANYGDQGISVGCIDTYKNNIDCQWIDITDVVPGIYTLKVSINPEFKVSELSFDNNAVICSLYYNMVSARVWNCSLTRP
ncbi:lysyl oxidase homolog 3-like [Brevipalpus obovatus]|uniref:lysyl oxidase homolog 3-like n=1 Tax=Brevipalpus obovatus TaxID=246614 RepID=UPI003D9F1EB9